MYAFVFETRPVDGGGVRPVDRGVYEYEVSPVSGGDVRPVDIDALKFEVRPVSDGGVRPVDRVAFDFGMRPVNGVAFQFRASGFVASAVSSRGRFCLRSVVRDEPQIVASNSVCCWCPLYCVWEE